MTICYINDVALSSSSEKKIQSIVDRDEFEVRTTVIHLALAQLRHRSMTKEQILQESVDSLQKSVAQAERGEARPMGEVMAELSERLPDRPQVPDGKLGLPKRLFDFVTENVTTEYSCDDLIEEAIQRYDEQIPTEVVP